ncbi:hypothetical protein ACOMHN_043527 [Nucella lapillus]
MSAAGGCEVVTSADDVDTRTETRERVDQPSSSPPPDRREARDLRRDVNAEGPPSFPGSPLPRLERGESGRSPPSSPPPGSRAARVNQLQSDVNSGGGGGVDVQMEASMAVTAMTGALLPPPPLRLAHGALRAGLSVTSTQGRVAGTPLVTLHWLSGAHQRDEVRTHCVVFQTARHVVHAVGQTRADRRDCLTTLETHRASLRQAQRVAEGDNPVPKEATCYLHYRQDLQNRRQSLNHVNIVIITASFQETINMKMQTTMFSKGVGSGRWLPSSALYGFTPVSAAVAYGTLSSWDSLQVNSANMQFAVEVPVRGALGLLLFGLFLSSSQRVLLGGDVEKNPGPNEIEKKIQEYVSKLETELVDSISQHLEKSVENQVTQLMQVVKC